jgi:hypothetical protein
MNFTLYTKFVLLHGNDQSLGGGFGQSLRNNDEDSAWGKADSKNSKKLELLLGKKNPFQNVEHETYLFGELL